MSSPYNHMHAMHSMHMIMQMQQHMMGRPGPMPSSPMAIPGAMMPPPEQHCSTPIVLGESEEEDEDDEDQRTLFVANLDDRVSEELLYEVFVQAGPVERVRIPKDHGGRQKTFGFVIFNHRCTPPYAMHLLQGLQFFRRTLIIKYNGKTMLPPLKSPILSSLPNPENPMEYAAQRGGNYSSSYNDNLMRMMGDNSTPPNSSALRHQDRSSRQQMRQHNNNSPYQRHDSPNHQYDKRRYHNNHNNNNGNSNRYSDRRSNSSSNNGGGGGKYRR